MQVKAYGKVFSVSLALLIAVAIEAVFFIIMFQFGEYSVALLFVLAAIIHYYV